MVDVVSELTRLSWDRVYELNIVEFLTYACYAKDKDKKRQKDMEKWVRKIH